MSRQPKNVPGEERSIAQLPELVQAMPAGARRVFQRLYRVSRSTGRLVAPESMHQWIRNYFGSVEAVETQTILKVTNAVTLESGLFNQLRASRPMDAKASGDLIQTIEQSAGDPFCHPLEGTPEDVFGRVRGRHSITASNVAKYDAFHGVVIFDRHNPLLLSQDRVKDYLETGYRWAQQALRADPEAKYYFFMWNALWKSGASIVHGHAQVACTRDVHYARVEALRRAALAYRQEAGSDYFSDLALVHRSLGLALEHEGATVISHLTPTKEKEVLILTPGLGDPLPDALYRVLDCFIGRLGVSSFNLAIYMPPLAETPEDWSGFPHMTRIVDRGDPMNRTNDVGAMELYASPVISSDPFRVAEALRERFER
ncbi:MAG: hypothetical protein M1337_05120 [Actinobacteria bacterium]|nr:hypothetical protein [Actinomycetota bacterium]